MSLDLAKGYWVLDPLHCTVEFTARHMGISKVRGRFSTFEATIEVGNTLADTVLRSTVDLTSVDTGNAQRDEHLRGSDFFNIHTHPEMTFESERIIDVGRGNYQIEGLLTINGITQPQTFDVVFYGIETFPQDGSTHAGFEATGELRRSDFEIDFNVPLGAGGVVVSDKIGIELDIQLQPATELTVA